MGGGGTEEEESIELVPLTRQEVETAFDVMSVLEFPLQVRPGRY
jgi:hypothetical protein